MQSSVLFAHVTKRPLFGTQHPFACPPPFGKQHVSWFSPKRVSVSFSEVCQPLPTKIVSVIYWNATTYVDKAAPLTTIPFTIVQFVCSVSQARFFMQIFRCCFACVFHTLYLIPCPNSIQLDLKKKTWVWVKIKPLGGRRFQSLVPFARATHLGVTLL